MNPRDVARSYAGGRLAVGVVLFLFPRLVVGRLAGGTRNVTPALVLMARLVGVRDALLGLGALAAVQDRDADRTRTWMTYGAIADAGDAVATVAGFRGLPRFSRVGLLLLALGGAATGAYARTAPLD